MVSKKNKSKPLTLVVANANKTKKIKAKKDKNKNKPLNVQKNDETLIEKSSLDNEILKDEIVENTISNESTQIISKKTENTEKSQKVFF
jgi:hypothetical protein